MWIPGAIRAKIHYLLFYILEYFLGKYFSPILDNFEDAASRTLVYVFQHLKELCDKIVAVVREESFLVCFLRRVEEFCDNIVNIIREESQNMDTTLGRVENIRPEVDEPSSSVPVPPEVSEKVESWIRENDLKTKPVEAWTFVDHGSDSESVMSEGSSDSIVILNREEADQRPVVLGSGADYVESLAGDATESVMTPDDAKSDMEVVLRPVNRVAARSRHESRKSYVHKRNQTVNQTLNLLLALTFSLGIGLGIGHFLGLTDDFPHRDGACPATKIKHRFDKPIMKSDFKLTESEEQFFASPNPKPAIAETLKVPVEKADSIFGALRNCFGKDCSDAGKKPRDRRVIADMKSIDSLAEKRDLEDFKTQKLATHSGDVSKWDVERQNEAALKGLEAAEVEKILERSDLDLAGKRDHDVTNFEQNLELPSVTPGIETSDDHGLEIFVVNDDAADDDVNQYYDTDKAVTSVNIKDTTVLPVADETVVLSKAEFYGVDTDRHDEIEDESLTKAAFYGARIPEDQLLDKSVFYGKVSEPEVVLSRAEFYGSRISDSAYSSLVDAAVGSGKVIRVDTYDTEIYAKRTEDSATSGQYQKPRGEKLEIDDDAVIVEVEESDVEIWNGTKTKKDKKNYDNFREKDGKPNERNDKDGKRKHQKNEKENRRSKNEYEKDSKKSKEGKNFDNYEEQKVKREYKHDEKERKKDKKQTQDKYKDKELEEFGKDKNENKDKRGKRKNESDGFEGKNKNSERNEKRKRGESREEKRDSSKERDDSKERKDRGGYRDERSKSSDKSSKQKQQIRERYDSRERGYRNEKRQERYDSRETNYKHKTHKYE